MAFGRQTPDPAAPPARTTVKVTDAVEVHRTHEFHIRDLATRTVTLFPSRARVVRDLKDVPLKPGINQITIVGLTPTLDEHSIKVEGTGAAIVTDLVVELLPNKEVFDDGEDDGSEEDQSGSGSDSEDGSDSETTELKELALQISQLSDKRRTALESMRSADQRLKLLDAYCHSAATRQKRQSQSLFEQSVGFYRDQRRCIFQDHLAAQNEETEVSAKLDRLKRKQDRLRRRASAQAAKARTAKEKERERELRRRLEKSKESERLRQEREAYWPKRVFVVKINMTSNKPSTNACDLTLSYITYHAFWSPSYDLALSTTSDSATLCFDARLTNQTSETWEECKISLSTSQTEFSGLGEPIPNLAPWRVRLSERRSHFGVADILYSPEENIHEADRTRQRNTRNLRHGNFGVERPAVPKVYRRKAAAASSPRSIFGPPAPSLFGPPAPTLFGPPAPNLFGPSVPPRTEGLSTGFGVPSNPSGGGLFGNTHPNSAQDSRAGAQLFGSSNDKPTFGSSNSYHLGSNQAATEPAEAPGQQREEGPDADYDSATLAELQPDLEFEESLSTFEETGITSTYDLPGLKTLRPSSVTSKQRVAHLKYSKVTFDRIVVAKYKRAALLTAKVCNDSQLILLKGQAGITLDGTFLGRLTLPRCSVGDSLTLSLGVDPSVQVSYPKPDFKHSPASIFSLSKDNTGLYSRIITLTNLRKGAGGGPLRLTVRDQVPVSEEERLKIEILKPSGLVVDSSGVDAGRSTCRSDDDKKSWGQARATLKRGGEVEWAVTINPGHSATLDLQYLCVAPAGAVAINAG